MKVAAKNQRRKIKGRMRIQIRVNQTAIGKMHADAAAEEMGVVGAALARHA